jgi:3'-phosphoadenosine 5'-phosphosulfate sulfotransferase (PAPS reductase)/FAD synthetase
MSNPYLIEGPALISFSGGRTSAYLLKHIIDAYGGTLPASVVACFANTGKEMPQTLDFVAECGERWGVSIVWMEYDPDGDPRRRFHVVDHATAARDGEPYAALISRKNYLPNPVTRFCTTELKIRVMRDYALSLGWENWINVLGLRYDEPQRVAKIKHNRDRWDNVAPLFDARVTKREVTAFWQAQDFDLTLPNVNGKTPHGNCDLCFLKAAKIITALIREEPARADWWIEQERACGATFRKDRADYAAILDSVLNQHDMDFGEIDALADCFCHE